MITHQGFRVESWALTYRCYIRRSLGLVLNDPSVHPFSPGQDCCMQPSDHMCTTVYTVQIQTLLLPAVYPAWIKSELTPSLPLIRVKQNPAINSKLMFQWGAKVMPHNWVCKYM